MLYAPINYSYSMRLPFCARMISKRSFCLAAILWLAPFSGAASVANQNQDEVWDSQVAPLLDRYCWNCHAGVRQKSGLDLRSLETALRGGERGPAIIPGK